MAVERPATQMREAPDTFSCCIASVCPLSLLLDCWAAGPRAFSLIYPAHTVTLDFRVDPVDRFIIISADSLRTQPYHSP